MRIELNGARTSGGTSPGRPGQTGQTGQIGPRRWTRRRLLGFGLGGAAPPGRVHGRLSAGTPPGGPAAPGDHAARLRRKPRQHLITAVAAISPAIWTSYAQARQANAGAYVSAAGDAITHAAALARVPVRVASGYDDPFYPGARALARALPAGAVLDFGPGCHTTPFFLAQEPPSLAFLARHLGPAKF